MRRYLLLFLMSASVALASTSCLPRLLVSGPVSSESGMAEGSAHIEMSESVQETGTYDFVLKAGRRELSGIMVARPVAPGSVRVVGTTYFGMTLFDMTLTSDSYTMNYVTEPLSGNAFASFLAMKLRKTMKL